MGDEKLNAFRDQTQVERDVLRTFSRLNRQADEIQKLREELSGLVAFILVKYPWLHYYQGYHDIAASVLLSHRHHHHHHQDQVPTKTTQATVTATTTTTTTSHDMEKATQTLERLTLSHLRDFMQPSLLPTLDILNLVMDLLHLVDEAVYEVLRQYQVDSIWALAKVLTLWTHSFDSPSQGPVSGENDDGTRDKKERGDGEKEAREMLAWLADREPVCIIYTVVASAVLSRSSILAIIDRDGRADEAIDVRDALFMALSQPPAQSVASITAVAGKLYETQDPRTLKSWHALSRNSCFKAHTYQEEANLHFAAHQREIEVRELRKKTSDERKRNWKRRWEAGAGYARREGIVIGVGGLLVLGLAWYVQH